MKLLRTLSVFFTMFLAQTVLAGCDMFNDEDDGATDGKGGNDGSEIAQGASIAIMIIYGIEWFVLLFPNTVPLARPASSMLGAVLCLLVTEICTHFDDVGGEFQAFCYIDYDTLALLFGLMLIVVMVDDSGILLMIEMQLEAKSKAWMITKCCFVCAILSAIVMNDTICLFFTAPILEACRKHPGIDDPLPFLLALSSNSNIGSALTITGNPQNAMIASISQNTSNDPITYYNFLVSMTLPCVVAWTINWLMLLVWYRKGLGLAGSDKDGGETAEDEGPILTEAEKKARKDTAEASNTYKLFLVVGIMLMVVGFFVGVDVAGISVAFGIIFMCTRTVISSRAKAKRSNQDLVDKDSEKFLLGVDWPLLVLFTGLFIMISACVQTGYPDDFFRATFASCKEDPTHDCTALFAVMIILFSNIISNVPLILLIKGYISGSMTNEVVARNNWMFISWVCTLAGNFILLGSAANLIVADQARKMGQDILSTINHGIFGIPSTVAYTVAGVPILLKTMI